MLKRLAAALSLALTLNAAVCLAQTPAVEPEKVDNPHVWKPRPASVAVFKNGLGFFTLEGDVDLRDGWCVAPRIPPASFGTLAVYSHKADETVDIIGAGPGEVFDFDGRDQPSDAAAKRARLDAAHNMNVSLTYTAKGAPRTAAGKLLSVGTDFVVLEGPDHSYAVPLDTLSKMQVLDLPLRMHVSNDKGQSPKSTRLGMAYLRKGITWIPEYTVKVLDDDTAEVTLRGTLVNEAEDLIHCDVQFVVGVPHFTHTEFLTPIAVGQVIRTIGAALAPAAVQSQMVRNVAVWNNDRADQFGTTERAAAPDAGDLNRVLGGLPQLDGPGGSDYTVYTKKDLTVRRGEKAIVTFFVRKVKFAHLYRLDLPEAMKHFLVLFNDTDTAWTTGPFVAVSGNRPLSEDLLRYTPRNGRCELPVTAAINIAHDRSETETDRKLKIYSPAQNVSYDLVTLRGEIRLRNLEKNPASVLITAQVPGKPLEGSDAATLSTNTSNLKLVERSGAFRWDIKIGPGESKTLTYSYERYVPSN